MNIYDHDHVNKVRSAAQRESVAKNDLMVSDFADGRPEQFMQQRIKEFVKKTSDVTTSVAMDRVDLSKSLGKPLQGNFKDRAISKLKEAELRDKEESNLDTHTCGDAARIVYKVLQNGGDSAGSGTGVASLLNAISDADRREGQVFIYFVDADIVGHFFTILQSRNQAVIIQGYLDKITIAQNIEDGGGAHKIWDTSQLKNDLKELVRLRDQIKNILDYSDPNEEGLVALGKVHTKLFGPGTDAKERLWIKRNILRKRADDMTWKASFADGEGPKLSTKGEGDGGSDNNSKCFLTTACTQYFGLPDDCEELTTLRMFRDEYMIKSEEGRQMVQRYYEIAPGIVRAIQMLPDCQALNVWTSIYQDIRLCVDAVNKGEPTLAMRTYRSRVLELEELFLDDPSIFE